MQIRTKRLLHLSYILKPGTVLFRGVDNKILQGGSLLNDHKWLNLKKLKGKSIIQPNNAIIQVLVTPLSVLIRDYRLESWRNSLYYE